MAMDQILKSYLIKLGVTIDDPSLLKAKAIMQEIENIANRHAEIITKMSNAGALAAVGMLAVVDTAILGTIKKVAEADLQYELLAQRMFMSKDAAKSFQIATDALGHSLSEIAWNPELKQHYFELVEVINKLKPPAESAELLENFRDLLFLFDRLKVIGGMALEHIAYHLLKINKGDFAEFYEKVLKFSDRVIEKLPEWSVKIADLLDVPLEITKSLIKFVWQLVENGTAFLKLLKDGFSYVWERLPDISKQIMILSGALLVFAAGSPLVVGFAAIASTLLLIDDFMARMEGRQSSKVLEPLWELMDLIAFGINGVIITSITLWDHFWTAVKGRKHESGLGALEHVQQELRLLQEVRDEQDANMSARRQARMTLGGIPVEIKSEDEFQKRMVRAGLSTSKVSDLQSEYGQDWQSIVIASMLGTEKANLVRKGLSSKSEEERAIAQEILNTQTESGKSIQEYVRAITGVDASSEYVEGLQRYMKREYTPEATGVIRRNLPGLYGDTTETEDNWRNLTPPSLPYSPRYFIDKSINKVLDKIFGDSKEEVEQAQDYKSWMSKMPPFLLYKHYNEVFKGFEEVGQAQDYINSARGNVVRRKMPIPEYSEDEYDNSEEGVRVRRRMPLNPEYSEDEYDNSGEGVRVRRKMPLNPVYSGDPKNVENNISIHITSTITDSSKLYEITKRAAIDAVIIAEKNRSAKLIMG
jgi:hypothetical protein